MRSLDVAVSTNGNVTLAFSSDREAVRDGESATLSWSSTNASTCTASGGWSGTRNTSGSFTTQSLTANTTFRLTCSNASGSQSAVQSLSVDVPDLLLRWSAPTQNVDGSDIASLSGFRLYWGRSSRNYTDSVQLGSSVREHDLGALQPGRWHLALTAIDGAGVESGYSNEVLKVVP